MREPPLSTRDLPLGTLFPDARYNQLLLQAMAEQKAERDVSAAAIATLEQARVELWDHANALKNEGLRAYGVLAAKSYGFHTRDGKLDYPWMASDHRRVGYGSNFYTCDLSQRKLVPVTIDHQRPRVIVFATGRAFAEQNARLGEITAEAAVQKARDIMSAQVYLVGSRLVPGYTENEVTVVAVAYDMVTSEKETPALRIQTLLDPGYRHPVSILAAERIFGSMIAEAETYPTGTLVRRDGRIVGKPLPDNEIIANLSRLVLVGGSVGCIVALQAARWLDGLLRELSVPETVREEAGRAFLILNLGPTTPLSAGATTNILSVMNIRDEFVFAGNHVQPLEDRARAAASHLIPDDAEANPAAANGWTAVLDAPGTITPTPDGLLLDPLGTHFGHSMKHYANSLRAMGVGSLVARALAHQGGFRLGELISEAESAGDLDTTWR